MEEKTTMFTTSVNTKHSTTVLGFIFILLSVAMIVVKYLLPSFIELRVADPYPGWVILIVILVGLILVYMNEDYFRELFGLGKKVAAKKLGVDDEKK
jgi:RsiW-degrading membrane proteinase PrsW (M82 family)